jgi:sarcosine oxidase subunit beta
MADKYQIVICGAGICGVSAAYYLARSGVQDILLLDEGAPLTLTSDRSTECYRNWWPDPQLVSLMNRSIDLMEQLAAESANVFHMNRRGYLYVTADPTKIPALLEESTRISSTGGGPLRVHSSEASKYAPESDDDFDRQPAGADLILDARTLRRHFPYLTESAVAALHVRRAGWLSAQQLGMHLLDQARGQGVKFRTGRVEEVRLSDGRIGGVTLGTGERIDCSVFVDAAGPYFKHVARLFGVDLPVETELHLKVAFDDHRNVLNRISPLLVWNDDQFLPWQPEEHALLRADPESQWLTGSLPGGAHTRPEGGSESRTILMLWDYHGRKMEPVFPLPLDDQYFEVVLRGLSAMLPGLRAYIGHAPRPKVDGGYYVKTPENRLLVGPSPVEGAYLIGAVSGYGIMSACAAGELLAAHVTGSALPPYAGAFALARYQDAKYRIELADMGDRGEL